MIFTETSGVIQITFDKYDTAHEREIVKLLMSLARVIVQLSQGEKK